VVEAEEVGQFPLAFPFIPAKYGMKYGKMSLPTLRSPEKPA
jgi:hypothetical protein